MQSELGQQRLESRSPSVQGNSLRRNKPFMLLLTGYTLSVAGNGFHSIALSLWILETTGSARMMSVVMGIYMISSLLFGAVAGTVADRSNRITLMTTADILRALFTIGVALCIGLSPDSTMIVFALVAFTAISGLFHSPAMQASMVKFAGTEQIQRSTSLVNIMENIARVSGLALGGIAITWFGGVAAILVDGCTFLISALLIFLAGRTLNGANETVVHDEVSESSIEDEQPAAERSKFLSDIWSGILFIKNDPVARAVIILSPSLMLFFTSCLMLIQVVAVKVWQVNPASFGLIEASFPVGYLAGSFLILTLDHRLQRRGWFIFAGIFLLGPTFVLMTFSRHLFLSIGLIFLAGFMFAFATLLVQIMLRLRVKTEMLGRAFGIIGSLTSVVPPGGLAVSAYCADYFGPASTLMVIGVLLSVIGIFTFLFLKPIRDFN
ncbi:MFS transporter [Paenibacillus lemnae]|uniref:MFS transporter n=1 Tax=Paenibacillus lemnae TaxID=1330551 RepID=A0A848M5C1_PAELE|nr:MFS transporter [Paenibacillus lemnae]NMO95431.1 MFS transporter [Paenibacillus lemnae]